MCRPQRTHTNARAAARCSYIFTWQLVLRRMLLSLVVHTERARTFAGVSSRPSVRRREQQPGGSRDELYTPRFRRSHGMGFARIYNRNCFFSLFSFFFFLRNCVRSFCSRCQLYMHFSISNPLSISSALCATVFFFIFLRMNRVYN